MRILLCAHNVAWQGSAIRALSLARPLARLGHDVTVLAARRSAGLRHVRELVDGVAVVEGPDLVPARLRNGGLSPLDLAARLAHVRGARYDVVHAFEPRPCATLPALLARRRGGARFVADWADLWGPDGMAAEWPLPQRVTLGAFDGRWQAATRRRADAVTVISRDLERRAAALGVLAGRMLRVPVGANDDVFRPLDAAPARVRLGIPQGALVLVHTGFAPFDDDLLGRAFGELARADRRVWMVTAGRRVPALDRHAAAAGAAERLLQLGVIPYAQLATVMACGDLMMLPYTDRPHNVARYPNRIGDYLAAGRPVVTNPTGDLGALVADERVGAVAPEDPAGFARVALDLLEAPARLAEMGARGRRLAETTLSWRTHAGALDGLYREIVASGPRGSSSS